MEDPRYASLRRYLQSLAPLPESEWEVFAKTLQVSKLATGESLVRFRGPYDPVAFVLKGLIKVYYTTRQGDEFIRAFCAENSFAAALAAIFQGPGTPSEVDMVAVEPTEVVTFPAAGFRSRLQEHWAWQQIGRVIAERYYMLRERRQFELMTMDAGERLKSFLAQYPGLASRISQKDLAAFIGITPVSLSRLRARLKDHDDAG